MRFDAGAAAAQCPIRFRTDDLDEAAEFLTRHFVDHSRVPKARGPLGFEIDFSVAARSAAGKVSFSIPSTVRTAVRAATVHLPLQRGATYRVGRRRLNSAPDVAVLLVPDHEYTVETPPGEALGIMLDQSLFERGLDAAGTGRAASAVPMCMELPLSKADTAAFSLLVRRHGASTREAGFSYDGQLRAVEHRMVSWLADRVVCALGLRPISPSGRQVAERVESWIRANASQPISLEKLSAVAGVGGRTLQKACLARWGQTPLELVASRRLALVRRMLATQAGIVNVTEAAARGGFTHLGRFSAQYKQAFGESPSDTLCRERRRSPAGAPATKPA